MTTPTWFAPFFPVKLADQRSLASMQQLTFMKTLFRSKCLFESCRAFKTLTQLKVKGYQPFLWSFHRSWVIHVYSDGVGVGEVHNFLAILKEFHSVGGANTHNPFSRLLACTTNGINLSVNVFIWLMCNRFADKISKTHSFLFFLMGGKFPLDVNDLITFCHCSLSTSWQFGNVCYLCCQDPKLPFIFISLNTFHLFLECFACDPSTEWQLAFILLKDWHMCFWFSFLCLPFMASTFEVKITGGHKNLY